MSKVLLQCRLVLAMLLYLKVDMSTEEDLPQQEENHKLVQTQNEASISNKLQCK